MNCCDFVQKNEPWENEKCEADMEKYEWEGSASQKAIQQLMKRLPNQEINQQLIDQYAQVITRFHNEGNPSVLSIQESNENF